LILMSISSQPGALGDIPTPGVHMTGSLTIPAPPSPFAVRVDCISNTPHCEVRVTGDLDIATAGQLTVAGVLSLRRPRVHGNQARAGGKQMRMRNVPARVPRLPAIASPLQSVASELVPTLREATGPERGRSRTGERP